jgi:thioredoxin reductase (NADPH)
MQEIDSATFEKEVLQAGKVVVDFYSTECPPCEALAPKYEALSKLYGDDIKFLKIFRQQNRDLADKLGVKSSPTLLFFDEGKEVATRLNGGIKRNEIVQRLDSFLPENKIKLINMTIGNV